MFMCIHIQVYAKEKEILLTFGISSMYIATILSLVFFLGGGYYIHVKTTKSNQLNPCLQVNFVNSNFDQIQLCATFFNDHANSI